MLCVGGKLTCDLVVPAAPYRCNLPVTHKQYWRGTSLM